MATYLRCLADLSCDELNERTNTRSPDGGDLSDHACYDESVETVTCR